MSPRIALLALLLLGTCLRLPVGATEGPASIQVLYPPAGSILTSARSLVMILGPDAAQPPAFRLDGEPLMVEKLTFAEAWKTIPPKVRVPAGDDDLPLRSALLADKAGKAVWTAIETLSEGEHEITLDGVTLAAFSSRAPEPTDAKSWDVPFLRVHGPPAGPDEGRNCAQCHEEATVGILGLAPVPATCYSCHAEVDLSLAHEHVMEFLEKCHMCHDPHAATRPKLLIDTRERVCAMCHESGYAR